MTFAPGIALIVGSLLASPSVIFAQSTNGAGKGATRGLLQQLEAGLRHDVGVLAHDSLRGRGTPSPELESAARYVADQFTSFGLTPFGAPGFIRHFPLYETRLVLDSVSLTFPGQPTLHLGANVALYQDHMAPPRANGELVLLTGMISDSALAHIDLSGTTVLVPRLAPGGGLSPNELSALSGLVMQSNPHAIIFVADLSDSAWRAHTIRPDSRRYVIHMDPLQMRGSTRFGHGIFVVRPSAVRAALAAHHVDIDDAIAHTNAPLRVQRFARVQAQVRVPRTIVKSDSAPLIIGMLRGADPARRDEYVVVSAHLDHLGVGAPDERGDSIYNGADDNVSGVATLLAVVRQFHHTGRRPPRSLLFFVTSGEERGLLGSDHFAGDRATPFDRFVANINIDGVGKPVWSDSIAVLGGAWSTLGEAARLATRRSEVGVNAAFTRYRYNGSDHFNFARRGLPSVHLFSGDLFPYYHTPADQIDVIDFPWLTRLARYTYALVDIVAAEKHRPRWTDPFHARGQTPW